MNFETPETRDYKSDLTAWLRNLPNRGRLAGALLGALLGFYFDFMVIGIFLNAWLFSALGREAMVYYLDRNSLAEEAPDAQQNPASKPASGPASGIETEEATAPVKTRSTESPQ